MNTAVRTRALTIAAGIFLVIAVIAYAATMFTGSTRSLAAGNLGATLAVVLYLGRVTARYARLIAAAGSVIAEDPVVSPRQSPEDAATNDERARRG
jgi:hypothetical protein